MKLNSSLIFSLIFILNSNYTFSQKVNAITANRAVTIGGAYQSEKESFVGQSCVTGDTVLAGIAQSTFNFSQSLSKKQAEDELGFSVGGKARFGVVEVSAAAQFMKSSVSSSYSISSVWLSEYTLPSEKLTTVKYADLVKNLRIQDSSKINYERWNQTCGDKYVDEIVRGAKLFFSIRVDFSSLEAKESFAAQFQLTGPLYSANASLSKASKEFSQDAKITFAAFQIGGDVSKLTGVFGNADTNTVKFVQCSLGNFNDCASVIQSAISYASNTQTGFPSQLAPGVKPGGAPLFYNLADYSAAGIYIDEYPFLDISVKRARAKLANIFEKQLSLSVLAERLLEIDLDNSQKSKILAQQNIIESNLLKIFSASEICYNNPYECVKTVDSLILRDVDETVFILPPLSTASFRLFTTIKGIWTRKESADTMNTVLSFYNKFNAAGFSVSGGYSRKPILDDFTNNGDEANTALFVEGQALKTADVYFENKKLLSISLKQSQVKFSEKAGTNYAVIVIETSRSFPDWQDINIYKLRQKLMENDLPKAEGMFYILVMDEFGRKVRFDIEYSKWDYSSRKEGGQKITNTRIESYTNWWDKNSDGTNGLVRNQWTNKSISELSSNIPSQ